MWKSCPTAQRGCGGAMGVSADKTRARRRSDLRLGANPPDGGRRPVRPGGAEQGRSGEIEKAGSSGSETAWHCGAAQARAARKERPQLQALGHPRAVQASPRGRPRRACLASGPAAVTVEAATRNLMAFVHSRGWSDVNQPGGVA